MKLHFLDWSIVPVSITLPGIFVVSLLGYFILFIHKRILKNLHIFIQISKLVWINNPNFASVLKILHICIV